MRFDFEKLEISLTRMCLGKAKINKHWNLLTNSINPYWISPICQPVLGYRQYVMEQNSCESLLSQRLEIWWVNKSGQPGLSLNAENHECGKPQERIYSKRNVKEGN